MNPRIRARVFEEWRGLPAQDFPRDTSKPVAEALKKVLSQLGIQHRVSHAEILALWKETVGDFLAQHSVPDRLMDGVLLVRVLQPTVHFELERTWKRPMLSKLQARFGRSVVREIRFRLG
jgi:predicted nucleic acid-binding Zn ribbon protein